MEQQKKISWTQLIRSGGTQELTAGARPIASADTNTTKKTHIAISLKGELRPEDAKNAGVLIALETPTGAVFNGE